MSISHKFTYVSRGEINNTSGYPGSLVKSESRAKSRPWCSVSNSQYREGGCTGIFTALSENLVGAGFFCITHQQYNILRHSPKRESGR